MRIILFFLLLSISKPSIAIDVNKGTISAFEYIKRGYVQYGVEELNKTAAANDLAAQFYIAVCYEHGIGFEKDLTHAFKMYRKSAERGLPDAMYHIASFYREGVVVAKDTSKEEEWLRRYKHKGGKKILSDIIQIYNEGIKFPENYALNPNEDYTNQSKLFTPNDGNGNPQKQTINNITIVQQTARENDNSTSQNSDMTIVEGVSSEVDMDIPISKIRQENTFALIIANENYHEVNKVSNAINDGRVFADYCEKALGIPHNNIKLITDATLNNIKRQINWIGQVLDAYDGKASVICYYAGHGIPNESNGFAYLLPVDGDSNDISTGYSLEKLYSEIGSKPAQSIIVFLDACFSGANRGDGMLTSARGVAIKAKQNVPKGKMVVLSAAQSDETAYSYEEKGHGMFTYYLLKKLQESKGDITIGELSDYIIAEVKKRSIVINGKKQTPTVNASISLQESWRNIKLR